VATWREDEVVTAGTAANTVLDKPSGTAEGDILIAVLSHENSPAVTPPSGWRLIGHIDHYAQVHDVYVYFKRAGGSEPTTYTWTHASNWRSGYIAAIQNASATVDPWVGLPNQGVGSTGTANGVTTLGDDALVMFVSATFDDRGPLTPPSGSNPTYSERWDSGNNLYIATGTLATAGATGDETISYGSSSNWSTLLVVVEDDGTTSGAPPPHIVATSTAALSTNDPALTFQGYTPVENDVVVMWPSSATVLGVVADSSLPSGWVNPLGDGVEVLSDAHGLCVLYHLVTAAEESGGTITYTATNALDAAETGNVAGCVVRAVDSTTVIDSINSTFDSSNATPHVLASLTGTNLSTGSLVLSCVAKDGTGAYTTTPSGWSFVETTNTNQGKALLSRNTFTTADTNVDATNITPSAGDEYASITVALLASTGGGGTNFTESPSDTEGLTDSLAVEQGEGLTDPLGLTDTRAIDQDKAAADTLGLTDTVTAERLHPESVTDTLDLTDTVTATLGREVAPADTLGLTDSIETETIKAVAPSDTLDLTDTVASQATYQRAATDDLGLTDSLTIAGDRTLEFTDPADLTDSLATEAIYNRAQTDNLGVTDSLTADVGKLVAATDTLGLSDSWTFDRGQGAADTLGVTDSLSFDLAIVIADDSGLTDTVAFTATYERSLTDNLGLVDTVDAFTGLVYHLTAVGSAARYTASSAPGRYRATPAPDRYRSE
jgi:hypothetical protein